MLLIAFFLMLSLCAQAGDYSYNFTIVNAAGESLGSGKVRLPFRLGAQGKGIAHWTFEATEVKDTNQNWSAAKDQLGAEKGEATAEGSGERLNLNFSPGWSDRNVVAIWNLKKQESGILFFQDYAGARECAFFRIVKSPQTSAIPAPKAVSIFTGKPLLVFSLTATNASFSHRLSKGMVLRAEGNAMGWDVGVFQGLSEDSLLYPQQNWHGAFPCQVSAWSQRTQTFPDERVIPVRDHKGAVGIRLIHAKVTGEIGNETFSGGRVEVFWSQDR